MRDSQDSKGGTLDEIPYTQEREFVESTSSRETEHQVEGWGCCPTVKNSDSELFLPKRTAGTEMERRLREMISSDKAKLESISRPGSTA